MKLGVPAIATLTLGILLVPLGWFICFTESIFPFNPLIETDVPPGFTIERFKAIQPGMTKAEVLQLIPPPGAEGSVSRNHWGYGGERSIGFGDFAFFYFNIEFDPQGRVRKTDHYPLYN